MDTNFKCLVIVLRALKCLGLCPLERQGKPKEAHYEFVWNSKTRVASLVVASCMVFVYFIALTHVVFQQGHIQVLCQQFGQFSFACARGS